MSMSIYRSRAHQRTQHGDTIVEVLISIAIASLILAGAYAITSRNLRTTQDTQEHNQAMQIVQQQIEGLRALSTTTTLATAVPASDCVIPNGAPSLASGAACTFGADGGGCGSSACYTVKITEPSTGIYEVKVTWDNLNGSTSSVSMDYGI